VAIDERDCLSANTRPYRQRGYQKNVTFCSSRSKVGCWSTQRL